ETQGLVIAESFAAGTPVIALKAPAIRNIMKDNETGRLIQEESPQAFVEGIQWYENLSVDEKENLHRRCIAEGKKYSIERSIDAIESLYTDGVNEKRHTPEDAQLQLLEKTRSRIDREVQMLQNFFQATGKAIRKSSH
ncbi:MAG: glycosyltransferase, partial [Fibrobacterota bacterium]